MAVGTYMAIDLDFKGSVYKLFGINAYEALWGLATNLVVAVALTAVLRAVGAGDSADETGGDDYEELDPVAGVQPLPATPGVRARRTPVGRLSGAIPSPDGPVPLGPGRPTSKMVRAEVPDYDRVQDEVARATEGVDARRVLELGTGTGVTSRRVLERHPHAQLTGVDSSEHMLAAADLPGRRPAPAGPARPAARGPVRPRLLRARHPPPRRSRARPTSSRASPPCSRPAGASCWPTSSCPRTRPTS